MQLIDRALRRYRQADFIIQQKARFIFILGLSVILILSLITAYSVLLQITDPQFDYRLRWGIIIPEILGMLVLFSTAILLTRGRFALASHMFLITAMGTTWLIMFFDHTAPVGRLDTIAFILGLMSIIPLAISHRARVVGYYATANLITLWIFMFLIRPQLDIPANSFWDYLADNTMAFIFSGIAGYNIFRITSRALERARDDLAQRTAAEAALEKSRQDLEHLTANIPGVVFQFYHRSESDQGFHYVSPRLDKILGPGLNRDNLLQSFGTGLIDADRDRFFLSIRQSIEQRQDWFFQGRFVKESGEQIWIRGQSRPDERTDEIVYNGILQDITEIKLTEKALYDSRESYRSLMERAPFPLVITRCSDNIVTYINAAGTKLFKLTPADLDSTISGYDFYRNPADSDRWTAEVERNGFVDSLEIELHSPCNPEHTMWGYFSSIRTAFEGEDVYLSMFNDVSPLKHSEMALRESEAKFRNFTEATPVAINIRQHDRIVYANPATFHLLGFTPEELYAMEDIFELVHPSDREMVISYGHKRAAGDHPPATYIFRLMAKDGRTVWVQTTTRLISYRGEPASLSTFIDITERRLAEQELRRLRNLLSNILDSMPSMLIGVDPQGHITHWNREAVKKTGLNASQAEGHMLGELLPELALEMNRIEEVIHRRKVHRSEKIAEKTGDETRFKDITIFPLIANGIDGAVIRIDDVTERVRIEEMMIQSEKMLSVGGLAAGMAHEINNPLAGILQNTQVMRNRLSPDLDKNRRVARECGLDFDKLSCYLEQRDILSMISAIMESGSRASRIVSNMLSFSRKSDSRQLPHDLRQLLDQTIDLAASDYDLKKHYDFKRIQILREYDDNLPQVQCEAGQIQQVLLNLLNNGAQAMAGLKDRDPQFILRLSAREAMVRLEIEDNGPGMNGKVLKHIFEPFYTTKAAGAGTGLGLSVSYFIITENHGGTLTAESTPDRGTRFIVQLPVSRKKA